MKWAESRIRGHELARLYMSGQSLRKIAQSAGVSVSVVRHAVRRSGLKREDEGCRKAAFDNNVKRDNLKRKARDQRALTMYGCLYSEVIALNDGQAISFPHGKAVRYQNRKKNAVLNSQPWDLSFPDWCKLWNDSGKYELLGLQKGKYALFRLDPAKPWSIGNAKVIDFIEGLRMVRKRALSSAKAPK